SGFHGVRVGHQTPEQDDRNVGGLPAVIGCLGGTSSKGASSKRPAKSAACPRSAYSDVCRADSRQRAGRERASERNDRRAKRASLSARWRLGAGRNAVHISETGGALA